MVLLYSICLDVRCGFLSSSRWRLRPVLNTRSFSQSPGAAQTWVLPPEDRTFDMLSLILTAIIVRTHAADWCHEGCHRTQCYRTASVWLPARVKPEVAAPPRTLALDYWPPSLDLTLLTCQFLQPWALQARSPPRSQLCPHTLGIIFQHINFFFFLRHMTSWKMVFKLFFII